jgi:hypothetical protein
MWGWGGARGESRGVGVCGEFWGEGKGGRWGCEVVVWGRVSVLAGCWGRGNGFTIMELGVGNLNRNACLGAILL